MKAGLFELDSAADATKTASNNDNVVNVTQRCRHFGGVFGRKAKPEASKKTILAMLFVVTMKRAPMIKDYYVVIDDLENICFSQKGAYACYRLLLGVTVNIIMPYLAQQLTVTITSCLWDHDVMKL